MNRSKWKAIFDKENDYWYGVANLCDSRISESLCCKNNAQDLQHLNKLGMIKNSSNGGLILESTPLRRFQMPKLNAIEKFDDMQRLQKNDKIWLNM